MDLVGRTLDRRFEVLAHIGSGGMGTVYRARQVSTDRLVAVKVLRSEFLEDESAIRLFFQEARALSRLTCPHTVTILDVGQDPDATFFLVMELLRGTPLSARIGFDQKPVGPVRAVRIAALRAPDRTPSAEPARSRPPTAAVAAEAPVRSPGETDAARHVGLYVRAAIQEWGMPMDDLERVRVFVPESQVRELGVRVRRPRLD